MPNDIGFFVFLAALFAGVAAILFAVRRKRTRLAEALAALGAKKIKSSLWAWATYGGTVDGVPYTLQHQERTKHQPSSLTVGIGSKLPLAFRIAKQDRSYRLLRFFGLSGELGSGTPALEESYFVEAGDTDELVPLWRNAEVKATLPLAFADGVTAVEASQGKLKAVWSPFEIGKALDLAFVHRAVATLSVMEQALEKAVPAATRALTQGQGIQGPGALKGAWVKGWALTALILAGLSLGIALGVWRALEPKALFFASLKITVPSAGLAIYAALRWCRKHLRTPRDVFSLVLSLFFLIPVLGFNGYALLNQWLDEAPPLDHDVLVVRKQSSRDRHGKDREHRFWVTSWREGHRWERLRAPYSLWKSAVPEKTHLKVTTKPGYLGFEWVVGMALAVPE